MKPLRCFVCNGHGYLLRSDGGKVTCNECGGCGLDGDVIRERADAARKGNDDRAWAQERDRRSGAYCDLD